MYQYPNQSAHNGYQQFFGVPATETVTNTQDNSSGAVPSYSLANPQPPSPKPQCEPPQSAVDGGQSAARRVPAPGARKGGVDTSSFTIEQRVVAAAWVHERHHTHTSIGQIKQQFSERFGRPAPAKNTLLVWERKLFSSGAVHDAPRSGRPARRKLLAGEVAASLRAAPALSVRARAAALRVPRSTRSALLSTCPHAPPRCARARTRRHSRPASTSPLATDPRKRQPVAARSGTRRPRSRRACSAARADT